MYDAGWQMTKRDEELQQIVPAANQLETIRRYRARMTYAASPGLANVNFLAFKI